MGCMTVVSLHVQHRGNCYLFLKGDSFFISEICV